MPDINHELVTNLDIATDIQKNQEEPAIAPALPMSLVDRFMFHEMLKEKIGRELTDNDLQLWDVIFGNIPSNSTELESFRKAIEKNHQIACMEQIQKSTQSKGSIKSDNGAMIPAPNKKNIDDLKKEEQELKSNIICSTQTKFQQKRFLTSDSFGVILDHIIQFRSGIDFQHLPLGFHLVRVPKNNSFYDVIHYSKYYAASQAIHKDTVFSITLHTQEELQSSPKEPVSFDGPQEKWYNFLKSKRVCDDGVFLYRG